MSVYSAIDDNDYEQFQKIMENGFNINTKDQDGQSLLTHVVHNAVVGWDYDDFIYYLLANGIDVNMTDKHGHTALMHTCMSNLPQIAMDMIKFYHSFDDAEECTQFDINMQNNFGKSSLMFAVKYTRNHKQQKKLIKTLLKHGAVNDLTDETGKTAIDYAETNSIKKLIRK